MAKRFDGAQVEAYPVHELDPTDANREVFKKTLLDVYESSDVGKQVQDPLSPDFDLMKARALRDRRWAGGVRLGGSALQRSGQQE